jgi:hypothetical protein
MSKWDASALGLVLAALIGQRGDDDAHQRFRRRVIRSQAGSDLRCDVAKLDRKADRGKSGGLND